jgi:hypothetical protein
MKLIRFQEIQLCYLETLAHQYKERLMKTLIREFKGL